MCAYCSMGDHQFRYDPPWRLDPNHPYAPLIPAPQVPQITPWDLARLTDYHDLLKRVKALEDALGCPCEPNKADYIKLFEERIAELEKRAQPRAD